MRVKRKISSDDSTLIYKVVFPLLFSVVGLIGTVVGVFNIQGDLWFLVIFWPVAIGWLLWFSSRLKWVSIDENTLYVAGTRKEIEIPFSEVALVKSSFMQRPKLITLVLKSPSTFGSKILFVPEQRVFESLRSGHPLVNELRTLLRAPADTENTLGADSP